ncbi:MAG: lytic murein transglycosylase [Sulfurovum sp.]
MKFLRRLIMVMLLPLILLSNDDRPPIKYDFLAKKEVKRFISMMVKKYHFKRSYMVSILRNARLDRDTLDRYTGRYKVGTTNGSWERYKAHVLDRKSLKKAKKFKREYYKILKKASRQYRVDMDYIIGFIAVESKFGEYSGDYRILDALATLAFHPNRMKKMFKSEFKHLFLMAREQGYNIKKLKGSFAGAMGVVQQLPSIFRRYGMDYNRDGKKDPWDLEDAIGIIAKFMHKNGWRKGVKVAVATKFKGKRYRRLRTSHRRTISLKKIRRHGIKPLASFPQSKAYLLKNRNKTHDDIWLGTRNFRVLTKYNNSTSYGMAIHLIAKHVK